MNRRAVIAMLASLVIAAGCTKPVVNSKPAEKCEQLPLEIHLSVGKQINRNTEGQPSPLEVRVLLLKDRTTFDGLDFRTVWREAKVELKDALVKTVSLTVFPGKDKIAPLSSPLSVGFVALVGLFRKPDESEWRSVVDIREPARECKAGGLHIPVQAVIRDNRIVKPQLSGQE